MNDADRLFAEVGAEWETSGPIAERARVEPKAAGQILARLARIGFVERQHDPEAGERRARTKGNWEYRRAR